VNPNGRQQLRRELPLQIRHVRILAPRFFSARRLFQVPDQTFRVADVQISLLDDLQRADLIRRVFQRQQRAGVSCGDLLVDQRLPGGFGKLQQPDGVGDRGAVLADAGGDLLLRKGKPVEQGLIGIRLLDRIQCLPLEVFNQGKFRQIPIFRLADDDGDLFQAGRLCRPPAPLAGNDLISVVRFPDDDRLDDAAFLHGGNQFPLVIVVEVPPGLKPVRSEFFDPALHERRAVADMIEKVGEHRPQAFAQRVLWRHHILPLLKISLASSM